MNIQQVGIFRALLGFSVTCLLAFNAQAALFDDYEARRDISDLRKKFV